MFLAFLVVLVLLCVFFNLLVFYWFGALLLNISPNSGKTKQQNTWTTTKNKTCWQQPTLLLWVVFCGFLEFCFVVGFPTMFLCFFCLSLVSAGLALP